MVEHPKYELESIKKGTTLFQGPWPKFNLNQPKNGSQAGHIVALHLLREMPQTTPRVWVRGHHAGQQRPTSALRGRTPTL